MCRIRLLDLLLPAAAPCLFLFLLTGLLYVQLQMKRHSEQLLVSVFNSSSLSVFSAVFKRLLI